MSATSAAELRSRLRLGRLAGAGLLLSMSILLSRVLGVARTIVISDVFGDTRQIEAYFAAFRIPDTMFTLVSGGALASAFIPVFAGLVHRREDGEAWRVASTVLNTVCIALAVLALFAFVLAPQIMGVVVCGGFTHAECTLTIDLTRIMLLQPIFLGAAALISAVLQSYGRFLLTALAPLLYNVIIVLGALFGHTYGVAGLAWSVVIGSCAQLAVQLPGIGPDVRLRYRRTIDWASRDAREVLRLFGPRVVGLAAFQAMLLITAALAARLPQGDLGAITYSWLLISFPVGALGTAAGTAIFPTLSRLSAADDVVAVRRTVYRSLRVVLFLAIPAAVGLIVLRRPIINLLWYHGLWLPRNTEQTAFALLFYALALAPLAAIEVLPRVFYAMLDTLTPVKIAGAAVALDAVLSIVFVRIFPRDSAQGGLALATAIATILQAVWLGRTLERRLGGVGGDGLLLTVRDTLVASAVMGLVLYVLLDPLAALFPQRGIGALITVIVQIGVGVATFGWIAYLLGAPELVEARSFVTRRN